MNVFKLVSFTACMHLYLLQPNFFSFCVIRDTTLFFHKTVHVFLHTDHNSPSLLSSCSFPMPPFYPHPQSTPSLERHHSYCRLLSVPLHLLFYFSPVVFMELYLLHPELYRVYPSFKAQHPVVLPQVRWLLNNFYKNISTILQE